MTCQKLARFIFPKSDPVINPSWAVDDRTLPEKFLNIMCNSLGLLTNLELEHWNKMCGRNCLFKEKSKYGIYSTDFNIKMEQRIYKKNMSRMKYINNLGADDPNNPTQTDFQLNLHSLNEEPFYNPLSSIDKIKIQPLSVTDLLKVYQNDRAP